MNEPLLQKMLQLIDEKTKDVDHVLTFQEKKKTELLMEKVELLRARKEIERDLLHAKGEKEIIQ